MLVSDFEPDSARCRLFARGGMPQPGFMVGASGSPGFVAGTVGGAILASGIASAVAQNQNFNDCMIARGWRVADGAPVTAPVVIQPSAPPPIAAAPADAGPVLGGRRKLLVRVSTVSEIGGEVAARPGRGLFVREVLPGGVGNSAGMLPGDVILTLNGSPVYTVADMQQQLRTVGPDTLAAATVWRNGQERPIPLRF